MLSRCRGSFCGQCHVLGFSEKMFLREELARPISTGEIYLELIKSKKGALFHPFRWRTGIKFLIKYITTGLIPNFVDTLASIR